MSEMLGRYRLVSLLATGGMGEVFLARQEGPGGFTKTVVVKRILRHLARDQGFVELFLNEARLAAQLQHPNIAQVFALEQDGESWFIAMEFVHGRSLRSIIDAAKERGLPLPIGVAVRICSQAASGLQFAHDLTDELGRPLGVLHRDVSPENILVGFSGVVKLIDFGIAKAMTRRLDTRVGKPKGKLAYMAPELRVPGASIDRRSDLYGLGVVLCEALTLERPLGNAAQQVEGGEVADWPGDPRLPERLDRIIAKAMAPRPQDRWESTEAFGEALEQYLTSVHLTVLPNAITAFLGALFGGRAQRANPAVIAVEVGVDHTGEYSALGTGPLPSSELLNSAAAARAVSTTEPAIQPVSNSQVDWSGHDSLPTVVSAPPFSERRPGTQSWLLGGVGLATAAVVLGIAMIGVTSRRSTVVSPLDAGASPDEVQPGPADPDQPPVLGSAQGLIPVAVQIPPPPAPAVEATSAPDAGPAPSRKPPRRVANRMGKVNVRVNPSAEVFVAGRSLGSSPLNGVELPVGDTTFTLRNAQLGVTKKVVIRVLAGQTVVLRADLKR